MKQTKIFQLTDADAENAYYIMSFVVGRCAGIQEDPDTGEDWTKYKNVTVSIIRSTKDIEEALESHNVVSNNVFKFTVAELAEDAAQDHYNDKIFAIGAAVGKLPIRRCSSRFYLKVEVE